MKRGIIILVLMLAVFSLAACRRGDDNQVEPMDIVIGDETLGIPRDTEGELTLFIWGGSSQLLRDVGRVYIAAEDLTGQYDAFIAATARAFNQIFPNIIINVYGRADGPYSHGIGWLQYRENFTLEHGAPDIFAITNLTDDIRRGMVADLTVFEDDPRFQVFNPGIMDMLNIGGRQFGIPLGAIPHGVFINRTLAEANNIDIPSPQWTIDEYIRFISHSSPNEFYGAMGIPYTLINSGTRDFYYQLANRGPNDPFVTINSQASRNLIARMPALIDHTLWPQNALGNVSAEFLNEHWWWGYRFFQMGRLLTHELEPWHLNDLGHEDPDWWGRAIMDDWDVFPRPSTPYMGNHLHMMLDFWGIRNIAMDDGNPILNEEEYNQLAIAWEFLVFMTGDTRAWEARAHQLFNSGGVMSHVVDNSLPMVLGGAFEEQMDLWFQSGRERFRDPNAMPGFHYVLELWQQGAFSSIQTRTIPWNHEFEGTVRNIAHEWTNMGSYAVTGASDLDHNWIDMLFARLPDWERSINERWAEEWARVYEAIERFYPEQVRGGR